MTALKLTPLAIFVAACTTPGPVRETPVPERAARLSVAKCSELAAAPEADYTQELKPRGQLKLFAKPELEGALGGVDREVLYGRKVADGVWAILVTDYDKKVCEAYVSEETAEPVNNDPGPTTAPDVGSPDMGDDDASAGP